MIRIVAAALASLLMICAAGGAHAQTNPDWLEKPDAADLSAVYPKFAQFIGVEGRTQISCKVARTGRLDNCVVVQEDPHGLGFGKAALGLVPYFRMAPGTAGGSARESLVRIPIRFALPPGDYDGPRALLALAGMLVLLAVLALNDLIRGRTAPRMPVWPAVAYGLRFAARSWRRTPGPLLVYVGLVILGSLLGPVEGEPTGAQMFSTIASAIIGVFISGAGLRLGFADLRPDDRAFRLGPLGFQAGGVEQRVLTVGLIMTLILIAIVAVVTIAGLGLSTALSNDAETRTPLVAGLTGVGILAAIFVVLRLWTATPVAVFQKHLDLRTAWRGTRAALFSPLAAATLIFMVAALVASVPVFAAAAVGAALHADTMRYAAIVYSAVALAIVQPAWTGLLVFAFKTLHAPADGATEA